MNRLESLNVIQRESNLISFLELERRLSFIIKEEVKELLLDYNVAKPQKTFYKKENIVFNLNFFFGFSKKKHEDFYYNYNTYLGRLPDELYPIASVDGGDLLLISKKDLSIYYWFHEEDDWGIEGVSKWPTKICSNLKEYLNQLILLTPLTEAEIEESLKGCTVTITPTFVKIKNDIRAKEGLSPLTLEEWEKELNNSKR